MLFSYLSTTSSLLPLLLLRLYSLVCHILLVISVPSGEFSAHSRNHRGRSCLEVTRGFRENGWNVWCNMGATQPIRIFLSPPSHYFTHWHGFTLFSTLFVMVHAMDLLLSALLPSFFPVHSVFPIIVWTGGLPAPDVRHCTVPLVAHCQPYPRPLPTIISPRLSISLARHIVRLYISRLLLPPPQIR